jgi:hypothetical protein
MLARSPNRKRAVEYLAACGATAITVIDRDGNASIIIGKTATGIVAARWWIAAQDAQRVASGARRLAGEGAEVSEVIEAVQRSAGSLRAALTPDEVAIRRAADSMMRLDAKIEAMKRDGTLRDFGARYKAARMRAKSEGRGYLSYNQALSRLKKLLIPALTSGQPISGLFNQIFR